MEEFIASLDHTEKEQFEALSLQLREGFPEDGFMDVLNSESFKSFDEKFTLHVKEKCDKLATYSFYNSYLHMSDLMLNFIRATRDGDWDMHLKTVAAMVPWLFSYDRLNYARYLPAYLYEMAALKKTHPTVADTLPNDFVVQQQDRHAFSQTAMTQTIEQTANRDSKTKGGLTGFTQIWLLFIDGSCRTPNGLK